MMKCPVCSKDKTLYEMRPLINVRELMVGNELSEQKSEQEVGGAKLQMVCRNCWQAILDSKEKSEVIEILETLAALLLEQDRKHREQAKAFELVEQIEKNSRINRSHPVQPHPHRDEFFPGQPIGIDPSWAPSTGTPMWQVGLEGRTINWGSVQSLGNDFELTCSALP